MIYPSINNNIAAIPKKGCKANNPATTRKMIM